MTYTYDRMVPRATFAYKFTGKERDSESGLDNFGARYDSSQYGRFMMPDRTVDQHTEDPQSMNLYSYVRNNPLNHTDPTGNFNCDKHDSQCGQSILADIALRQAASDVNNPNMFALQKVSDALGTYGDNNGVIINSADLGARNPDGTITYAQTFGKVITFNNNSNIPSQTGADFLSNLVHEGTHIMQLNEQNTPVIQYTSFFGRLWGAFTQSGNRTRSDNFHDEYEAFQNEGYIQEYMHYAGQIYDPTLKDEAETKHMQQRVAELADVNACRETRGCEQ